MHRAGNGRSMRRLASWGLTLVIGLTTPVALAQYFGWAKQVGGTEQEAANAVVVDSEGNLYTAGGFQGTADFDPGPDAQELTSAGNYDVFLAKFDRLGNLVWAQRFGSTDYDYALDLAVDSDGNLTLVGGFSGTVDFDPVPGTHALTSSGSTDAFVARFDGDGNLAWARRVGGAGLDQALSVAVDPAGSAYAVGEFDQTADFDPGPDTFTLTSAGFSDGFVCRLDSAGNFAWAGQFRSTERVRARGIALDPAGDAYIVGEFRDRLDFDPGPGSLSSFGYTSSVFVSRLTGSGGLVWAGTLPSAHCGNSSVALDAHGNVLTVGSFANEADFDPGPGWYPLDAGDVDDAFVSKLDSSGEFVWARHFEGPEPTVATGVAADASGRVYTVGRFRGTVDFAPGPATDERTSRGLDDIFVSRLSEAGSLDWVAQLGGSDMDNAIGAALDSDSGLHTVGSFRGSSDFDPGPEAYELTSAGSGDAFIARLSPFPDTDTDGDAIPDYQDNCPLTANETQLDTDGDQAGDACDADDDGDGTPDADDCAPLIAGVWSPPPAVGDTLRLDGRAGEATNLSWLPGEQAHQWNVYRGSIDGTIPGGPEEPTCWLAGVPLTAADDEETPPPLQAFSYLVGAVNPCGESTIGQYATRRAGVETGLNIVAGNCRGARQSRESSAGHSGRLP